MSPPGKYPTHVLPRLDRVRAWAAQGRDLEGIARSLDVSPASLRRYRRAHPDLARALAGRNPPPEGERGPARETGPRTQYPEGEGAACEAGPRTQCPAGEGGPAGDPVESALLRRALGYDWTEVTREFRVTQDDQGNDVRQLTKEKEVTHHVAGDLSAQRFWLTNRRGRRWRGRPDLPADDLGDTGVVLLAPQDPEPQPPGEEDPYA